MIDKRSVFRVAPIVVGVVFTVAAFGCGAGGEDTTSDQTPGSSITAVEEVASEAVAPHGVEAADLLGAWLLEDMSGHGVADGVETTMVFDADGRVAGSGGCNRFTGSYTFEEGRLSFGPLAGTKMMCPDAVMNQEDGFLRALGGAVRVEMDGPILVLTVEGSENPLRFARMETGATD